MPNLNPTLAEEVIALTSPIKYHQIFTLSATQTRGPMRVTYSIAGPEPRGGDEDVPTVLFVGGMFGTRWMAVAINWLAEKEGVRVLFVDRWVDNIPFYVLGFYAITQDDRQLRLRHKLKALPFPFLTPSAFPSSQGEGQVSKPNGKQSHITHSPPLSSQTRLWRLHCSPILNYPFCSNRHLP